MISVYIPQGILFVGTVNERTAKIGITEWLAYRLAIAPCTAKIIFRAGTV
jgi:hypothetical protein